MEAAVKIYTTNVCAYCMAAKALLRRRDIPYEEINVGGQPSMRDWLVQTTGQRTVPQIFIRGQSIGGYVELAALDKAGKLTAMLQEGAPA